MSGDRSVWNRPAVTIGGQGRGEPGLNGRRRTPKGTRPSQDSISTRGETSPGQGLDTGDGVNSLPADLPNGRPGRGTPMAWPIDATDVTGTAMIRLAAIGDLHIRASVSDSLWSDLGSLGGRVDALVVAGDITDGGRLTEAEQAAELFRAVAVPVVAVLGNHDLRCLRRATFRRVLERSGVVLLDGDRFVLTASTGAKIGFAGVGGAGGGFWPVEGPDALHSRAMKALAVRAKREAARLDAALGGLDADLRIAVTHFAPTCSTLGREPIGKYWMLGNSELGRIIDRHRVDLVFHGHAHLGNPTGSTRGGTPVLNVASTVSGGLLIHDLEPPVHGGDGRPRPDHAPVAVCLA